MTITPHKNIILIGSGEINTAILRDMITAYPDMEILILTQSPNIQTHHEAVGLPVLPVDDTIIINKQEPMNKKILLTIGMAMLAMEINNPTRIPHSRYLDEPKCLPLPKDRLKNPILKAGNVKQEFYYESKWGVITIKADKQKTADKKIKQIIALNNQLYG